MLPIDPHSTTDGLCTSAVSGLRSTVPNSWSILSCLQRKPMASLVLHMSTQSIPSLAITLTNRASTSRKAPASLQVRKACTTGERCPTLSVPLLHSVTTLYAWSWWVKNFIFVPSWLSLWRQAPPVWVHVRTPLAYEVSDPPQQDTDHYFFDPFRVRFFCLLWIRHLHVPYLYLSAGSPSHQCYFTNSPVRYPLSPEAFVLPIKIVLMPDLLWFITVAHFRIKRRPARTLELRCDSDTTYRWHQSGVHFDQPRKSPRFNSTIADQRY